VYAKKEKYFATILQLMSSNVQTQFSVHPFIRFEEVAMRPHAMLFLALLTALLALGAGGQELTTRQQPPSALGDLKSYQDFDLSRYEKNFVASLEYPDCNDIVEAGLAQVAMLKLAQPIAPCKRLRSRVEDLAITGETPAIRFKAYLTSMVFEHPELFIYEKYGTYTNGEQLFTALARRMTKEILAAQ
jgi:hypothetical protein